MSRSALVRLFFGEGEFDFRLGIGELEQLEEVTKRDDVRIGPQAMMKCLADGSWLVRDVRETLRLGLVGAGMDKEKAFDLVKRHLEPADLARATAVAIAIIGAALIGGPGDEAGAPVGEPIAAAGRRRRPSQTAASTSAGS